MAFSITQFGRVEFDPMSVPQGTDGRDADAGESFAGALERAVARDERAAGPSERSRSFGSDPHPESAPETQAPQPGASPDAPADGTPAPETVAAQAANQRTDRADPNTIDEEGTSASRETAGKGAGVSSSSTSSSTGDASAKGPTVLDALGRGPAAPVGMTQVVASDSAVTGATAVSFAATRSTGANQSVTASFGVDDAAPKSNTPTKTQAPVGYRTINPQTLQLAEQARDSVIRQIAMRLNSEGGEMRVLVDPPELGELEMKMVVEGDTMRLSITAERPEVALMLQKHLAELRNALAQQGTTITEAEVHTRDPHAERGDRSGRDGQTNDDGTSGNASQDDAANSENRAPRGYFTADGFDLWI